MVTKLQAAAKAARSGAATIIAAGAEKEVLIRIAAGDDVGTVLWPATNRIAARKQWLAGQLQASGQLTLDGGAVEVLKKEGRSLLAVGVTDVNGDFSRGDLVVCLDPDGQEVARGLVNYNANETQRIAGRSSESIKDILGYVDEPELIHRDNLVLV